MSEQEAYFSLRLSAYPTSSEIEKLEEDSFYSNALVTTLLGIMDYSREKFGYPDDKFLINLTNRIFNSPAKELSELIEDCKKMEDKNFSINDIRGLLIKNLSLMDEIKNDCR